MEEEAGERVRERRQRGKVKAEGLGKEGGGSMSREMEEWVARDSGRGLQTEKDRGEERGRRF